MQKKALFRLHFIVFLWGFTAILGKLINVDAQHLVFYRMLLASLCLFVFIRFIAKDSLRVPAKLYAQLTAVGFAMAVHWLCFFYAIKVSNVAVALSCLSVSTIFVSLLEPLVYRRKIDWSEIFLGIIIMACISLIFQVEFQHKIGIIAGIICAFFGAVFSVFNGKLYGKTSSSKIIFYEIFGGWILVAAFLMLTGDTAALADISMRDFGWIFLLASVFTAYPMLESVSLMKYISPFTLVLTVNLEPVYGIIFAFIIFGESEKMSPYFYAASAVMLLAIIINGVLKSRRKKSAIETAP